MTETSVEVARPRDRRQNQCLMYSGGADRALPGAQLGFRGNCGPPRGLTFGPVS
jgi:hypothetical protein